MTRQIKTDKRNAYLSFSALNLSVALMFVAILWPKPELLTMQPIVAAQASAHVKTPVITQPIVGTPVRIEVPSVGIDTSVQAGDYDFQNDTWTIGTNSAYYATATVPVNNANGTTLIYGHAGWGIFEALPSVAVGVEAIVSTSEGQRFIYTSIDNRQVNPSDVSFITASGAPQLVLQTCSGAFDTYRTLVTFTLKGIM